MLTTLFAARLPQLSRFCGRGYVYLVPVLGQLDTRQLHRNAEKKVQRLAVDRIAFASGP